MKAVKFLTYQEQLELVQHDLARVSINENMSTFKYAKRVMFDYLWKQHPELRACRGHTYNNSTGEAVTCPPMKSFNYLEDGWWNDVPLSTPIVAYKKYNGFMAAATTANGELVVSTTGTTKSDYAKWAKAKIEKEAYLPFEGTTGLYEIIVPQDPHIVKEESEGSVLLGLMTNLVGNWTPTGRYFSGTLAEILQITEKDKGEGFMVYLQNEEGEASDVHNPCKLKTPYYVGKKKLMRAGVKNVSQLFNNTRHYLTGFHLMWEEVAHKIKHEYTEQEWLATPEQQRRAAIEMITG